MFKIRSVAECSSGVLVAAAGLVQRCLRLEPGTRGIITISKRTRRI